MSYRIASFNIQNFSEKAATNSSRKDLDMIAKIIRDNSVDIVAIQEILHKEALKFLIEKIDHQYALEDRFANGVKYYTSIWTDTGTKELAGYCTKHWEGRWASPRSKYSDTVAEGYAFLWNRDRIKLVTDYNGKAFEPQIETYAGKQHLARPPFVGRFMPVNSRYEFRLINTHIVFSAKAPEEQQEEDMMVQHESSIERRKNELLTLLERVYIGVADKVYDINRQDRNARPLSSYTFLLGDYNLNLPLSSTNHSKMTGLDVYIDGSGKHEIITVNKELTTLKQIPSDPEKAEWLKRNPNPADHLANNYDHFSYDIKKLNSHQIHTPTVTVIDAFSLYKNRNESNDCHAEYELYRQKISDHLPILLEIDIQKGKNTRRTIFDE